jgi:hypothetical protein
MVDALVNAPSVVNRNGRKVGFRNGARSRDWGRVTARRVRATKQVAGIRTGRLVVNAFGTQALDEPHLFETLESEMRRSESNCQLTTTEGRGRRRPRWTVENRRFLDRAKPAINRRRPRPVSCTSFLCRCANPSPLSSASSEVRTSARAAAPDPVRTAYCDAGLRLIGGTMPTAR